MLIFVANVGVRLTLVVSLSFRLSANQMPMLPQYQIDLEFLHQIDEIAYHEFSFLSLVMKPNKLRSMR